MEQNEHDLPDSARSCASIHQKSVRAQWRLISSRGFVQRKRPVEHTDQFTANNERNDANAKSRTGREERAACAC
jgi:hypothetical protein